MDTSCQLLDATDRMSLCNTQIMLGISKDGHHAVYTELDISPIHHTQKPRKILSYKKANWEGLKEHMNKSCKEILQNNSVDTPADTVWNKFTSSLDEAISQYVQGTLQNV